MAKVEQNEPQKAELTRVLITRSPNRASPFTQALARLVPGLGVDYVPLRQARFVQPSADCFEALAQGEYDWVAVTSVNGVAASARWAQVMNTRLPDLFSTARIACVGGATEAALARCGVAADFLPQIQDAAHMVADWPDPGPKNILCLQSQTARDTLATGLSALGHDVTVETIYTMVAYPADDPLTLTGVLDAGQERETAEGGETLNRETARARLGRYAAVVATAPSLLTELFAPVEDLNSCAGGDSLPCVVAIGASTAACAQELGLAYRVADSPSPLDLARAVRNTVSTAVTSP